MPKYPINLQMQLMKYDEICKEERKRIIEGYKKYGDSFRSDDLVLEMKQELLDIFGYLTLLKIRRESER